MQRRRSTARLGASRTTAIHWKRNLAVLSVVQALSTLGFGLVFPFLPLYVKELGTTMGGSLEFWAGMVFSLQAFTMMIASPIWGSVADRNGRKLMLERATLGGALIVTAMGFVQSAEQLALLRALQGAMTGVIAANNALVAAQTPRSRTGFALGVLNMARWAGVAGGPFVGGVLGEYFGFRESFWITGALLAIAGLAVFFWVQEDFFATGTAAMDIDGWPDASFDHASVEDNFEVPCSLKFFEDHIIHFAPSIDQGSGQNGERAPFFHFAGGTEKGLRFLKGVGIEAAGEEFT